MEAERPLGERTVVVQLLKTARMARAASAGMNSFRMLVGFLFNSESVAEVSVSFLTGGYEENFSANSRRLTLPRSVTGISSTNNIRRGTCQVLK